MFSRMFRRRRAGPEWYRANGRISSRYRWGDVLGARVRGRTNTYMVFGSPLALDCSCAYPHLPCPHVSAVLREWEAQPESFIDLRSKVEARPDAEELERAILRVVLSNPAPIADALRTRRFDRLRSLGER